MICAIACTSGTHPLVRLRDVRRSAKRPACQRVSNVIHKKAWRDRRGIASDRLSVAPDQELRLRTQQQLVLDHLPVGTRSRSGSCSTHEVPVDLARQDAGEVVVHDVVGHAAARGCGKAVVRVRVVAAREPAVAASVRFAWLTQHRLVVDRQLGHEGVRLRRG